MADITESAPKRRRGPGRPWPKGVSANPGGRKPVPPEVKDALRAAEPQAVAKLVELVSDPDPAIALKASLAVIERVRGPVTQKMQLEHSLGDLTDEQLEARFRLITASTSVASPPKAGES